MWTSWSPTTVAPNMLTFENLLSCGICKVATWELGNINERVFRGPRWLGELIMLACLLACLMVACLLTYLLTHSLTHLLTHSLSHSLTHSLTPWSGVLLEKLTGSQVVKKFPAFYGTWRSITTFKSAPHLYLSWASSIQSLAPPPIQFPEVPFECYPPIYAWVFQFVSFPQGSPPKTLYATLLAPSTRATCPAHPILLDLITRIVCGEEYRSLSFSVYSFLLSHVTLSLFGPPYSQTPSAYLHPLVRVTMFHTHTKRQDSSVYLNLYGFG